MNSSTSAKIIPKPLAPAASINTPRVVEVARDVLDNNDMDDADILSITSSSSRAQEDYGETSTAAAVAVDVGPQATTEQERQLQQSPNHFKLQTTYDGSIQSTHGVEFTIENKNVDNQYAIISALGLNVAGSSSPPLCRIKLYTKPVDLTSAQTTNNNSTGYRLALDTTEVMCLNDGAETLIPTEAFLQYYRSKDSERRLQLSDDEMDYPLLIPPKGAVSIYVVVLPVDDSQPNPFSLISTPGSVVSALYKADMDVNLYEGGAISNAYLVDDPNGGDAEVTAPTVFNGAVYYDLLDESSSLRKYYDDLENALLPGDMPGPGCDVSVSTGYIDTIGSFGIMFDVASAVPPAEGDDTTSENQDLEIFGLDVYIRNLVNTSIEVYARIDGEGSYMSYSPIEGQTKIVANWELVAKGTIEGRGPGVGTPIPHKAWLKNVVLKPGHAVGFYVTVLDGPDLRYRNSTIPEGSIYTTDGTLNVGVGRSWGEYPLRGDGTDVSFYPREFSGTFHYHAHGSACKTQPPSGAPTVSPAPTTEIANAYKDEEGMCPSENELATTFQDGTGSYCILYDVSPKVDLTVTGIDLNVDWNSADEAQVAVYAKNGSWFGFQNDLQAWPYIVANTTLSKPVGFHDRKTQGPVIPLEEKMTSAIIPKKSFKPMPMKEGETWAFYACTSIADLRYTIGSSIGKTCASNSELRVHEGAGGADFPQFGQEVKGIDYTFYAPRVPSLTMRYDYVAECPSEPPSSFDFTPSPTPIPTLTTAVTYTFYAEHSADKSMADVTYDMEYGVRGVLGSFVKDNSNPLYEHGVKDGLVVTTVRGVVVSAMDVGYLCIPEAPKTCTAVSIQVEVVHYDTVSSDEILYDLLNQSDDVQKELNVEGYEVEYVGSRAVETDSEVTLSGVPGREMGGSEQEYFAQVAKDFLNNQVVSDNDSLQILAVTVNGQEITAESAAESGLSGVRRRLQSANRINVSVKGQYKPPPKINFGEVVEESINRDRELLKKELTSRPPPTSVEGDLSEVPEFADYFADAEVVGARELKKPEQSRVSVLNKDQERDDNLKDILNYAAFGLSGMIFLLTSVFFFRPRRFKAMLRSKSSDYHMDTHDVDVEEEQMTALKAQTRQDMRGYDNEEYIYTSHASMNYEQQQMQPDMGYNQGRSSIRNPSLTPSRGPTYSDQVHMSQTSRGQYY
eukprot:CAMPEP_0201714376 /NCGR_PEP_ID=MMETSP0593-20130828/889_1 /ASSEMBLY_ACC=CAM_ASM_000672 /TAXON_ID=267983 /ORGANISM="Skeletonema japonicum, Strain CCMP2506" /LENGTH=1181 /DNA_ID=CAMNT_0048203651 /DNA_START=149 /DNA_END=3694 /DNA_ORIENTATION=-